MSSNNDFEKQWLNKLQKGLIKVGREDLFLELIKKKESHDTIDWSSILMKKFNNTLNDDQIADVMCSCACLAPRTTLEACKLEFAQSGELHKTHKLLQQTFEKMIRQYKDLNEEQMEFLRKNGWGMAGKLEGNTIIATKIPKDFYEYFKASGSKQKKFHYCHCPRIRDVFLKGSEKKISPEYCYCGAGFYKDLWEYILSKPVKVEILKSLMKGDDICTICIHLK